MVALLQVPAALPQVLPRPFVVFVEPVAVGRGGVVGGGGAVITAADVLLGGSVLGPGGSVCVN